MLPYYRRFLPAAGYLDRILKDRKPADLPVQAPIQALPEESRTASAGIEARCTIAAAATLPFSSSQCVMRRRSACPRRRGYRMCREFITRRGGCVAAGGAGAAAGGHAPRRGAAPSGGGLYRISDSQGAKSDVSKWRRHSRSVLRYASAYSSFLQTQREYSC